MGNMRIFSICALSFIVLFSEYLCTCENIPQYYKTSWIKSDYVRENSAEFKFHSEYAKKMYAAKPPSTPNIACFGISLHLKTGTPIVLPFDFFITSEINKSYMQSDQKGSENKKSSKKGIGTDSSATIISGYSTLSISDAFCIECPFINVSSKKKLESFLSIVQQNLLQYNSVYGVQNLINFYDNNQDAIKSNDKIGNIYDNKGKSSENVNKEIGSLLHCEQVILLQLLFREAYRDGLFKYLHSKLPKYKYYDDISYVTLDIITYIDMCPKCFATCELFFDNLKNIILSNLFPEHSADDIPFQIIVSSLQSYKIAASDEFTRNSSNNNTLLEVFYAEPSYYTENIKGKIIQFVNPWLMESHFNSLYGSVDNTIKGLSLSELLDQFAKMIKLKEVQYNVIKTPQKDYFKELYSSFYKKYRELLSTLCNTALQISSYAPELLDEYRNLLRDTLNQIQNQTESVQDHQQEEFEHNNNKKD